MMTDIIAEGTAYHSVMQFEPNQADEILGPLLLERAWSNIPVFGPDKADRDSILQKSLAASSHDTVVVDEIASTACLPQSFADATAAAAKLRALRSYSKEHLQPESQKTPARGTDVAKVMDSMTLSSGDLQTSYQARHENLLGLTLGTKGFPVEAQGILDHTMLLRAKEKYLFNCEHNQKVVSDDIFLRDVWAWVAGKMALSSHRFLGALLTSQKVRRRL